MGCTVIRGSFIPRIIPKLKLLCQTGIAAIMVVAQSSLFEQYSELMSIGSIMVLVYYNRILQGMIWPYLSVFFYLANQQLSLDLDPGWTIQATIRGLNQSNLLIESTSVLSWLMGGMSLGISYLICEEEDGQLAHGTWNP
ncbi:hypothetical protein DSO57_1036592 [Entomophthora muscae]|uniref:Uncharacterized protein n=1 Tax=Entomophthora muscae TaxID=34485 RepID=A0ACC2S153_9FUNG|nr:hypothetical protein DSO57_1036592 [Entomophthora muscae]